MQKVTKSVSGAIVALVLLFVPFYVHAENRDVVVPKTRDSLLREPLRTGELGGELDRRIRDLVYKNYMVLDLDRDWLDHFRHRIDRNGTRNVYYGIGKVIDAGSLFARYTGDAKVAARTDYLVDELRKTRDPDGYLGFWNVEPNNEQNKINWILHEQEYINLALVHNYRTTGNPVPLADAKIMADYIMRSFPKNEKGVNHIKPGISIAGIAEGFIELYRVTGDEKYLNFAQNLQYEPHWYYEPWPEWSARIDRRRFHLYVMMSHMYPETEMYRLTGNADRLLKSRWLQHALLEKGHGALLVTGSGSEGEHFTYNQKGSGQIEESCVTAYLLRLFDSLMRIDGDMRLGDVMERTIYNALFGAQSPDGRHICYFTPFTGKRHFQDRDTFCCNGNFRRAVAELPEKVCYRTADAGIALNLYTNMDKVFDVDGKPVRVREETDYPNSGEVRLTFEPAEPVRFSFRFRTPLWCEKMTVRVNDEKPLEIVPAQQRNGCFELTRDWKKRDTVRLSMPMDWRLVRGRAVQKGYVALLRGPVLFCIGESLNKELLKRVPDPRRLVLDPSSLKAPERDDSVRPNGMKVRAKAWLDSAQTGERVDVVLNEFVDPSGMDVYFRIPNLQDAAPVRLMDDELLFEPQTTPELDIVAALYGPEFKGALENLMDRGPIVADLARDYVAPGGRTDLAATFSDGGKGNWSLWHIQNRNVSPDPPGNTQLLHSRYKVYATPTGFAYGWSDRDELGFVASHDPSNRQAPLWKTNFTEEVMDKSIPEGERNDYLYHHPTADPNGALAIRWTPDRGRKEKMFAIETTVCSRATGNGVGISVFSVAPDGVKNKILQTSTSNGQLRDRSMVGFLTTFVPAQARDHYEVVIDNNGDYICDTTAIKIRIRALDAPNDQMDVIQILQSIASGKSKTDLAPFADRFGKSAAGETKTLKLKLRERETGEMIYRQIPANGTLSL